MTKTGLVARKSTTIHAPPAKVWEALTNPELIKKYLFGTETTSDWKVGSSITYRGVWQGKSYEDKGKILQIVPERILQSTYWSSMRGLEDTPENYAIVTYELEPVEGNRTRLSVTQENIDSEEEREHSESNWGMVLEAMKKLLEERS
ncbi:MAG TPA: SRPBCC domain-containing protein [Nitrososphaerales archaeon]|nr:SRPBCC domain-containing protein [Nitrososphaerales archaeon]